MYTLYILKCADNSLYTGIAKNLKERIKTHRAGKGSKYVKTRLPVEIIYTEKFKNRSYASKREYEIKTWSKKQKIQRLNLDLN